MPIPKCEVCRTNEAVSFSYFGDRAAGIPNGRWKIACWCTANTEAYYVEFASLLNNPWLDHLRSKPWFDEQDFCQCIARAGLTLTPATE